MKHYLYTDTINWADECDVVFGAIIDEETYLKYKYAQEQLDEYLSSFSFGSNEGWDDDFNYLQAEFIELTENEFEVLDKFKLPSGEDYVFEFFDKLSEELRWDLSSFDKIFTKEKYPDLYRCANGEFSKYPYTENCSLETFKKIIDWYKNERES